MDGLITQQMDGLITQQTQILTPKESIYTLEPRSKEPAIKANLPIWHGFDETQFYLFYS